MHWITPTEKDTDAADQFRANSHVSSSHSGNGEFRHSFICPLL